MLPSLKGFIEKHPSILEDFQKLMQPISLPKGYLLHRGAKVCHYSYYIHQGAARAFYFKDGKDITAYFAFENEAITGIDSILKGSPSKYDIELLEDSNISKLNKVEVEAFYQQSILHERYGRLFLQQIYMDMVERLEDLQFLNARQRYLQLLEKHPHIIQRVELRHISSFLGITQETLSRVRAK